MVLGSIGCLAVAVAVHCSIGGGGDVVAGGLSQHITTTHLINIMVRGQKKIKYKMQIALNITYHLSKLCSSETDSLKGLFTIFLFLVRSHILSSNGVWYS